MNILQTSNDLYKELLSKINSHHLSELKKAQGSLLLSDKQQYYIEIDDFINQIMLDSANKLIFDEKCILNIILLCLSSEDLLDLGLMENLIEQLEIDFTDTTSKVFDLKLITPLISKISPKDISKIANKTNTPSQKTIENKDLNEDNTISHRKINKNLSNLLNSFDCYLNSLTMVDFAKNQNYSTHYLDELINNLIHKNDEINFCFKNLLDFENDLNNNNNIVVEDFFYVIQKLKNVSNKYYSSYTTALEDNEILKEWVNRVEIEKEKQFNTINDYELKLRDYDDLQKLLFEKNQQIYELQLCLEKNQISLEKNEINCNEKVTDLNQKLNQNRLSCEILEQEANNFRKMYNDLNKVDSVDQNLIEIGKSFTIRNENSLSESAQKEKQEILQKSSNFKLTSSNYKLNNRYSQMNDADLKNLVSSRFSQQVSEGHDFFTQSNESDTNGNKENHNTNERKENYSFNFQVNPVKVISRINSLKKINRIQPDSPPDIDKFKLSPIFREKFKESGWKLKNVTQKSSFLKMDTINSHDDNSMLDHNLTRKFDDKNIESVRKLVNHSINIIKQKNDSEILQNKAESVFNDLENTSESYKLKPFQVLKNMQLDEQSDNEQKIGVTKTISTKEIISEINLSQVSNNTFLSSNQDEKNSTQCDELYIKKLKEKYSIGKQEVDHKRIISDILGNIGEIINHRNTSGISPEQSNKNAMLESRLFNSLHMDEDVDNISYKSPSLRLFTDNVEKNIKTRRDFIEVTPLQLTKSSKLNSQRSRSYEVTPRYDTNRFNSATKPHRTTPRYDSFESVDLIQSNIKKSMPISEMVSNVDLISEKVTNNMRKNSKSNINCNLGNSNYVEESQLNFYENKAGDVTLEDSVLRNSSNICYSEKSWPRKEDDMHQNIGTNKDSKYDQNHYQDYQMQILKLFPCEKSNLIKKKCVDDGIYNSVDSKLKDPIKQHKSLVIKTDQEFQFNLDLYQDKILKETPKFLNAFNIFPLVNNEQTRIQELNILNCEFDDFQNVGIKTPERLERNSTSEELESSQVGFKKSVVFGQRIELDVDSNLERSTIKDLENLERNPYPEQLDSTEYSFSDQEILGEVRQRDIYRNLRSVSSYPNSERTFKCTLSNNIVRKTEQCTQTNNPNEKIEQYTQTANFNDNTEISTQTNDCNKKTELFNQTENPNEKTDQCSQTNSTEKCYKLTKSVQNKFKHKNKLNYENEQHENYFCNYATSYQDNNNLYKTKNFENVSLKKNFGKISNESIVESNQEFKKVSQHSVLKVTSLPIVEVLRDIDTYKEFSNAKLLENIVKKGIESMKNKSMQILKSNNLFISQYTNFEKFSEQGILKITNLSTVLVWRDIGTYKEFSNKSLLENIVRKGIKSKRNA